MLKTVPDFAKLLLILHQKFYYMNLLKNFSSWLCFSLLPSLTFNRTLFSSKLINYELKSKQLSIPTVRIIPLVMVKKPPAVKENGEALTLVAKNSIILWKKVMINSNAHDISPISSISAIFYCKKRNKRSQKSRYIKCPKFIIAIELKSQRIAKHINWS